MYDLVMPAFQQLEAPKKHLVWIAGADQEMLTEKTDWLGRRSTLMAKERKQVRLPPAGVNCTPLPWQIGDLRGIYIRCVGPITLVRIAKNPFGDRA